MAGCGGGRSKASAAAFSALTTIKDSGADWKVKLAEGTVEDFDLHTSV